MLQFVKIHMRLIESCNSLGILTIVLLYSIIGSSHKSISMPKIHLDINDFFLKEFKYDRLIL
jgi:hypothetical protein